MYQLNCQRCGEAFTSSRPQSRYCSPHCKRVVAYELEKERKLMPLFKCSGPLLRLADVPAQVRIRAFRELVDSGELSADEIPLALAAVVEPGDLSARAA